MVRQHSSRYNKKRKTGMSTMMLLFWIIIIIGGLIGLFSLLSYVPAGGTNFTSPITGR